MAIFSNTKIATESLDEYPNIIGTEECGMNITCEASADIYKLLSGMYVSDILIENAVDEGATNAEELMEATVKEIAIKARNKFIELKNKIVAWFKKVVESIKNFFMDASKFATKYEKQLLEKASVLKDYTYHGYVYAEAFDAKEEFDGIKGVADTARNAKTLKNLAEPSEGYTELFKTFDNSETIGEVVAYMKKTMRSNKESAEDIKVTKTLVSTMIKFCKAYSANISAIDTAKKTTENVINGIINDLKAEDGDGALLQRKIRYYNMATSYIQNVNSVIVSMYKEAYRTYGGVLKGVLTTKKVTESYDSDSNLFESAGFVDQALKMI